MLTSTIPLSWNDIKTRAASFVLERSPVLKGADKAVTVKEN